MWILMMWWNQDGPNTGDWFVMSFMMVIFWGLLVALVLWLVRGNRRDHRTAAHLVGESTQRADVVLADQFARGEIDEDEFTKRRQVLHATSHRP